jgi:ankyrin repeat protein
MIKIAPLLLCLLFIGLTAASCTESPPVSDHKQVSPLITAAEIGDIGRLETLLSEQAEVDCRDSCKWTPLMKAALNGHQAVTDRLLSAGAGIDLTDNGGYSALMLAASNNHFLLVDRLLEEGANPNMQEMTRGWTALIWAAKRGHRESVERLLQAGAAPDIRDFEGRSAADWARQNDHQLIARLLTESPFRPGLATRPALRQGATAEEIRDEDKQ